MPERCLTFKVKKLCKYIYILKTCISFNLSRFIYVYNKRECVCMYVCVCLYVYVCMHVCVCVCKILSHYLRQLTKYIPTCIMTH